MPRSKVILVVGSFGSGKTSLIRRASTGRCPAAPPPTVGIDLEAGRMLITPVQDDLMEELALELPPAGLELHMWEIGGKEPEREAPRGQPLDGLVICYDCTNRGSFLRAAHALCRYRMDTHLAHARLQGHAPSPEKHLPAVLVGTKADIAGSAGAVSVEEVQLFLREHRVEGAFLTSAKTGDGVARPFQALALAALRAEHLHGLQREVAAEVAAQPAAESWSLRAGVAAAAGGRAAHVMTSPRGLRPHEPARGGGPADALVEVVGPEAGAGSGGAEVVCAPRTAFECLRRGLPHRAVHVWLWVPRQGALLVRRYAPHALKHPSRWGPTCHGEVHCYGAGGDGHASELSAQAAERLLLEQIGVDAVEVGALDHWFSCRSRDGTCHELLDIYVAAIGGRGLPQLALHPSEEVDWAYFEDVLSMAAVEAETICHMEAEYRAEMLRRLREHAVPQDVHAAFGPDGVRVDSGRWPCGRGTGR